MRAQLGVAEDELVGDDVSRCQQLATEAREAGFEGILAPSAALDGETTLAVFAMAIHKVVAEHSRVQRPPIRMIRVLEWMGVPDAAVDTVGRLYRVLAALGRRVRGDDRSPPRVRFAKDEFPTQAVYGDLDHAGLRLITCGGQFDRQARS